MSHFGYDIDSLTKKLQMIEATKFCLEFPDNGKTKKDPKLQELVESLENQGFEKDKDFFVSTNFINFISSDAYSAAIMLT